jgi:hypothetical protein
MRQKRIMRERPSGIHVIVTQSVEPMDFEAWADRYVGAVVDAVKVSERVPEAA